MLIQQHQRTKTLQIKPNNRSSDFVTPNFIYGCAGGCRNSYCYVMRYNHEKLFINDNLTEILARILQHADTLIYPKPINQVDPLYWVYDIGCSTDIALHWKNYDWQRVFDFFRDHPRLKATFATKYVNPALLSYPATNKIRLRFSMMPQKISHILEPGTAKIGKRIFAIEKFIEAGYEVHINFSPIVVYDTWLQDYAELFKQIEAAVPSCYHEMVKAECIFMTHNPWQHERNINANQLASEALLWQPQLQENKVSEYGSQAVRYKSGLKRKFIQDFTKLHHKILPWNTIRYIF